MLPRIVAKSEKRFFSKFVLLFGVLKGPGGITPYHHVVVGATSYRSVENFLNLTTEFLGRGPRSRPKTKNSNHYNSKPETDFVTIPTGFRNVTGGLKKVLKIFRQGTPEGVELENVPRPQKFQTPISKNL